MVVFVTGASGYIGRHVVKSLLDAGHSVIASDFRPDGIDPRASFCNVPIFSGDPNIWEAVGCPDVCIHMAWKDGFVHNSDAHMDMLSSHVRFCRDMMRSGLKGLSVMGSMHEVGYWEGPITADTPCTPLSQYGIAKNALRSSLMQLAQQTSCRLHWLRAYYITGDDLKSSSIFSKIVQANRDGKKEFPLNSGKNLYDFVDVDTLAEMIAAASVQFEINGIINVCTGKPMSLGDRVSQFIEEHGFDIKLQFGVFPDRPYDSPGVWGDATDIQKIMSSSKAKPAEDVGQ